MKNIILIGMPGAGKSTVGVLLAKALGTDFIDTDILLQKTSGMLLPDIIRLEGLSSFTKRENDVLRTIKPTGSVIATGGSAVLCAEGMSHLKKTGTTFYLKIALNTVVSRINNISTRGIVMEGSQTLADIYSIRTPLYETYADKRVDCEGLSPEETVCRIIGLF